jgi:hypothetical protein
MGLRLDKSINTFKQVKQSIATECKTCDNY